MTNICGHERDVLIWALRHWALSPEHAIKIASEQYPRDETCSAVKDTSDPAKLAEMLAHEGRRLGFARRDAKIVNIDAPIPAPMYACVEHRLVSIYVLLPRRARWDRHRLEMPQARALLLKWLNLPDGVREEAERVLRGSNADPTKLAP